MTTMANERPADRLKPGASRRRIRDRRLTSDQILAEELQRSLGVTPDPIAPQVLAADITRLLDDLVPLTRWVHERIDTTERHLSFLGPETRKSIDQAIRAERRARIDTTKRPAGLQWMRGTTNEDSIGVGKLGGRPAAISAEAEVTFTLLDLVRRLHTGIDRAGVVCLLLRPLHEPTVQDLVDHLTVLVKVTADGYGWTQLLPGALRDVEHAVDTATLVVDGPGKAEYGDCPLCGRPTIVAYFEADEGEDLIVRCDRDRRTGHFEPCTCTNAYCACKYRPTSHRHEWHKSRTHAHDGIWTFERLRRQAEADSQEPPA